MNDSSTTAERQSPSVFKRVTAHHAFFSPSHSVDSLFSVCADVPASDALEQASTFLSAALFSVQEAADKTLHESVYGAAYLVEMSKAIVDAAIAAICKEERDHG